MGKGLVAMKQKYLGHAHPGQDLCWCEINIGVNAVVVTRFRAGVFVHQKFYEGSAADVLKSKLRLFYRRTKVESRWQFLPHSPGYFRMFIYYPSVRWHAERQPPLVLASVDAL